MTKENFNYTIILITIQMINTLNIYGIKSPFGEDYQQSEKAGTMGRRSIESIRREEIILALFQVISRKGLDKASMREIAKAAGCHHGILRHYFGNKESLLKEAVDYLIKKYITELQRDSKQCESSMGQLRFFFQSFRFERVGMELSQAWIELFVFSKNNPEIQRSFQSAYKTLREILKNIIRGGISSGEFRRRDPELTADMIVAALEGALFLNLLHLESTSHELMNEQFYQCFLEYVEKKQI